MVMVKVKCAQCGAEGNISLVDPVYHGPFRCWKCRAFYTIRLEKNVLVSCEPLSEAEFKIRYPKKRPYD